MPFLAFYLTGLVLEMDALYVVKAFLLVCFYSLLHFLSNLLFDDDLKNIFPLSVYLATKVRRGRGRAGGALGRGASDACACCRCGSTSRGWCSWRAR